MPAGDETSTASMRDGSQRWSPGTVLYHGRARRRPEEASRLAAPVEGIGEKTAREERSMGHSRRRRKPQSWRI